MLDLYKGRVVSVAAVMTVTLTEEVQPGIWMTTDGVEVKAIELISVDEARAFNKKRQPNRREVTNEYSR